MSRAERLGTTISLILLGLALAPIILLPSRELGLSVFGSRWTFHLSGMMQFTLVLAGLACASVDGIVREHPTMRGVSVLYSATYWGLPVIVIVGGLLLTRQVSWWGYRAIVILLCGGLLALIARSQYETVDPSSRRYRLARVFLNTLTYACSLYFFSVLVGTSMGLLRVAAGVALISVMLSLGLFRQERQEWQRTWLYALLVGLVMGEIAWELGQNATLAGDAAGLLLVIYYVVAGVAQQHLWGRLTARVALEYGALGLAGLAVILGVA